MAMLRAIRESPYDAFATLLPHRREGVAPSLARHVFEDPLPVLEWTGEGVHAERWGRLHAVHHAMEPVTEVGGADRVVAASSHKLLVVQMLTGQSHADVRDWFAGCRGPGLGSATTAKLLAAVRRGIHEGEQTWFGFDPRAGRVRIRWPWEETSNFHDVALMRAIWGAYFTSSAPSELASDLLRWVA